MCVRMRACVCVCVCGGVGITRAYVEGWKTMVWFAEGKVNKHGWLRGTVL